MKTSDFKRSYIWQLPVRIFHWVNAFSILVLVITGFIIANPPTIMTGKEAVNQFWFGYVRMAHFIAAYTMVVVMVMRVYWAFKGNKYAKWRVFFPFSKKGFKKMWRVIKYDLFLQNEKDYDFKNNSVGHNNVAAFSYLIMFLLALVMIATGFALYSPNATWFLPKMFNWVTPLLGGDFNVRLVHHAAMWMFIFFTIVHVYLVFYHDWLEGRGETSAMISGYKFVRKERVKKDDTKKKDISEEKIAS